MLEVPSFPLLLRIMWLITLYFLRIWFVVQGDCVVTQHFWCITILQHIFPLFQNKLQLLRFGWFYLLFWLHCNQLCSHNIWSRGDWKGAGLRPKKLIDRLISSSWLWVLKFLPLLYNFLFPLDSYLVSVSLYTCHIFIRSILCVWSV